jgi:hypothetical protein
MRCIGIYSKIWIKAFHQIDIDEYVTAQAPTALPNPFNLKETAVLRAFGVTMVCTHTRVLPRNIMN